MWFLHWIMDPGEFFFLSKRHYWDNWQNLNQICGLADSIISQFLDLNNYAVVI